MSLSIPNIDRKLTDKRYFYSANFDKDFIFVSDVPITNLLLQAWFNILRECK